MRAARSASPGCSLPCSPLSRRSRSSWRRQAREDFRHPRPRLAVLPPLERRLHQRPDLVDEEARLVVEALQLLAVGPEEPGLVVPGVDVAWPAVDEQPDDRLRLALEVR